jgi:valyl-tRNA synthetase
LIGKEIKLPITGRLIPIIADEHADPELGSGAVKITPGHDFNDFEVGKRAGFAAGDMLNMLDAEGRVVQCGGIPDDLIGLDRFEARKRVIEMIEADGVLERVEDRVIQTPYGDRSGVVIEPWLTDQWYVDAKTLAGPAIEAVRSGAIKVVPQSWEKTWFQWLENIQPWCVSRQLWWGHRIPAWYGPRAFVDEDGVTKVTIAASGKPNEVAWFDFVEESEEAATAAAILRYESILKVPVQIEIGKVTSEGGVAGPRAKPLDDGSWLIRLFQEPDVLDTWFSSALWPFGTLGWPEALDNPSPLAGEGDSASAERGEGVKGKPSTSSLAPLSPLAVGESLSPARGERQSLLSKHYPNDVLISGFDILFFWDARMAMQGLHFMKEVPWKTLYLHGLVRAPDGSKMSKSKGNTVDPLGLIDQYGADALRFTLAAMESQGRDIKLDEKRVEGYRNFATKLWNAARFLQGNGVGASVSVAAPAATLAVNKWIIGEVVETLAKLDQAIADLRYDAMADAIYHFAWGTFCDWYIELVKGAFDDETRAVAGWAFDQILVMLHPFMPFITEELWGSMGARGGDLLIHARWPEPGAVVDAEAKDEIEWCIRLVAEVRSARTAVNVPPAAKLPLFVEIGGRKLDQRHLQSQALLQRIARVSELGVIGNSGIRQTVGVSDSDDHEMMLVAGRGAIQFTVDDLMYVIPLEGVIDLDAERARLTKGIEAAEKEAASLAGRLNNPAFVEKAKPEAVEKARADHAEKSAEAERLRAALARLG